MPAAAKNQSSAPCAINRVNYRTTFTVVHRLPTLNVSANPLPSNRASPDEPVGSIT